MQGPFVSSPRSGCEQHRETHQRTCDSSCSFHEISISVNLRPRVKQIQPLAGRDTSRRFLFRCSELLVKAALRLPAELPVICHALMANHAGFLCRTCDRRNKSIGQVVGAPRNHFEPAFVSRVQQERSVMTRSPPATTAALLDSTKRLIVPLGAS